MLEYNGIRHILVVS